jgi:hypothetical protein
MIESKLTELLERAGDQTDVGPPPIDAMYARVARVRRRRTVALSLAASVAVVAAAGGTALLVRPGTSSEDTPPPVASTSPGVVPAEMRLVGVGHAAIAVPKGWATNKEHCGTPQADTVIYDLGAVFLCLMPRPSGVESVELASGKPAIFDFHADETFEIDGVPAERQRTSCTTRPLDHVEVCSGTVFIPSLDASFRAQSSTSADEVDRLLERITIVSDRVGVPAFRSIGEDGQGPTAEKYTAALSKLGLKPKIQTIKSPSYDPGQLIAVSPIPGTMVPLGATVTLTVVAR